MIQVGEADD